MLSAAILLVLFAAFLLASTSGPKAPKDPTTRYIEELREERRKQALRAAQKALRT